jgi:hypothetical protein
MVHHFDQRPPRTFNIRRFGAVGTVFNLGAIKQYATFKCPMTLELLGETSAIYGIFNLISMFALSRKKTDVNKLKGPWNLGRFLKPTGAIVCVFGTLMIPILCFPAVRGSDLNAPIMN